MAPRAGAIARTPGFREQGRVRSDSPSRSSSAFVLGRMEAHNDNRPPAEASRILPILGRVCPDGRLRLDRPLNAKILDFPRSPWPSDPREA